eukprot:TRINITY_DN16502_c0_g1_i3.p1 TRINITY_DN16502_c0_g1~~TRINITY_DN16502_c0_g1_i3.p1  ORF type:complete len:830 (+),score=228.96 TRINITY_DN16502_c0_g1_i3:69-2492(+)
MASYGPDSETAGGSSSSTATPGSFFKHRPLDAPDAFEKLCRQCFAWLWREVFSVIHADFQGTADTHLFHQRAVAQLQSLAINGPSPNAAKAESFNGKDSRLPEVRRKVCLGVAYLLLMEDWSKASPGALQFYMAFLATVDNEHILVRALCVLASRWPDLQSMRRQRLLSFVSDIAEIFWEGTEQVLLALQREAFPGSALAWQSGLLAELLQILNSRAAWLASRPASPPSKRSQTSACCRTFLWALRWLAAARSLQAADPALQALRGNLKALAAGLWQNGREKVLEAGPALLWPLLQVREEGEFSVFYERCLEEDKVLAKRETPLCCCQHMLCSKELEALEFLVPRKDGAAAAVACQPLHLEWFAQRYLGADAVACSDEHLADVVVCAIAIAEARHARVAEQLPFWEFFWELSGKTGGKTARLAFIFMARKPGGYGRNVLSTVLASKEKTHDALEKASKHVEDMVQLHMRALAKGGASSSSSPTPPAAAAGQEPQAQAPAVSSPAVPALATQRRASEQPEHARDVVEEGVVEAKTTTKEDAEAEEDNGEQGQPTLGLAPPEPEREAADDAAPPCVPAASSEKAGRQAEEVGEDVEDEILEEVEEEEGDEDLEEALLADLAADEEADAERGFAEAMVAATASEDRQQAQKGEKMLPAAQERADEYLPPAAQASGLAAEGATVKEAALPAERATGLTQTQPAPPGDDGGAVSEEEEELFEEVLEEFEEEELVHSEEELEAALLEDMRVAEAMDDTHVEATLPPMDNGHSEPAAKQRGRSEEEVAASSSEAAPAPAPARPAKRSRRLPPAR